jgi:hypothetical protein
VEFGQGRQDRRSRSLAVLDAGDDSLDLRQSSIIELAELTTTDLVHLLHEITVILAQRRSLRDKAPFTGAQRSGTRWRARHQRVPAPKA